MDNEKNNTIKKEIFIKDLINYVGKEIKQPFLAKNATISSRGNERWQNIVLSDSTGNIEARAYAENINEEYKSFANSVVLVTGMVGINQDKATLLVSDIKKQESFNMSDYIYMLVKDKEDLLRNELFNYIDMIQNESLSALTRRIFLNNKIFNALVTLPAGLNNHNYCGALLVHILEVVRLSLIVMDSFIGYDVLCDVRPYKFNVDKDIVITAALLHDIGNYSSFSNLPDQRITTRGHKIPVSVETISMIDAYNITLPKEQQCNDMVDLKHIILAACGDISPMTFEALIVSNANKMAEDLDSYGHTFYHYDVARPYNDDCIVLSKHLGHEVVRKSILETRKTDINENIDNKYEK